MAKIAILNAKKMDFDGSLDFSVPGHDVVVWDETTLDDLTEHMEGCDAIVTKEMVLPSEVVAAFPENLKLIVEELGATLEDIVKCDVFLSTMKDFDRMNVVYEKYFGTTCPPARSGVALELWGGMKIEVSAIVKL